MRTLTTAALVLVPALTACSDTPRGQGVIWPDMLSALAAAALVLFACVQWRLDVRRREDHKQALEDEKAASYVRARGPAWLVRRTLQQVLAEAARRIDVRQWIDYAGRRDAMDRMEAQMLEVLREGSRAGGEHETAATDALTHFLAFADHANDAVDMQPSDPSRLGVEWSEPQMARSFELAEAALDHARKAIERLEHFAPPEAHEGPVPDKSAFRILASE